MTDLGRFEWLRAVLGDDEAEDIYAELSSGGSAAGRLVAATVSYHAREKRSDVFPVADRPALVSWALVFDDHPWLTPELAERAVDALQDESTVSAVDVVGVAGKFESHRL